MILVKDMLRHKTPDVWSIGPEATIYETLELMAAKDIGAVPVVEEGRLVGIFSERDYARGVALRGKSSHDMKVRELMNYPVFTIGPDETIDACMSLMTDRHIRHLPVVSSGGRLVGLISIGDVVKAIITDQRLYIRDLEKYIAGAPGAGMS